MLCTILPVFCNTLPAFIDSHAHLEEFGDAGAVVKRAKEAGCVAIVSAGHTPEANGKNLALAAGYPGYVYATIGLHPEWLVKVGEEEFGKAFAFVREHASEAVAIGEIGLDFHWSQHQTSKTNAALIPKPDVVRSKEKKEQERQEKTFLKQLEFALEINKPIVIHSRDAEKECIDILEGHGAKKVQMHFFSGDLVQAKRAIDLGYFLSTPPLLSRARREWLKIIPLGQLLLETDAPLASPLPQSIADGAELLAKTKGISIDALLNATRENARMFFALK